MSGHQVVWLQVVWSPSCLVTVQSITYEPNNSIIESLGEESVIRMKKFRGALTGNNNGSSNTETNRSGKKGTEEKTATNAQRTLLSPFYKKKPKQLSYSEGLKKLFMNPSILCQCSGPVDISSPRHNIYDIQDNSTVLDDSIQN